MIRRHLPMIRLRHGALLLNSVEYLYEQHYVPMLFVYDDVFSYTFTRFSPYRFCKFNFECICEKPNLNLGMESIVTHSLLFGMTYWMIFFNTSHSLLKLK